MTTRPDDPYLWLLREHLTATNKVAQRFAWSYTRVERLMPLNPTTIEALTDEDEEKLDAFLLRFNSLTAMVQDHVTKSLLSVEEEDIKYLSRKDQRLLMEKLGALPPSLDLWLIPLSQALTISCGSGRWLRPAMLRDGNGAAPPNQPLEA